MLNTSAKFVSKKIKIKIEQNNKIAQIMQPRAKKTT
jgi:hypothetical protein